MLSRALACALERLVPFYRGQMVRDLARALAGAGEKAGLEYLDILDAGEIKRAHRLAVAMRARRDAARSGHRPTRGGGIAETLITLIRRLADLIRRHDK
jgi:hypothetical protein